MSVFEVMWVSDPLPTGRPVQNINPQWAWGKTGVITVTNASISPTQAGVAASIVAGTVTVNAAWSKDGVNTVTSNTLSLTAQ